MTYPPPHGQPYQPQPPVDPYVTPNPTQPYYGQTGYGYQPPPPPPKSRALAITLLSVAIGLVLLLGGATVFYLIGQNVSADDDKRLSQGTTEPTETTSPPKADIRISEPDTLNGQRKIQADEVASLTTDLESVLRGYPGAANAFGAVYGSIADKEMTAALAAEVDIDDPQRMLDTMFQSFSGENQLTGVSPASTGSLGGVAQCGSSKVGKEDLAICGWADEGSVGMILYFYETAVDVKGDFPDMRAEIETKR